MKILLDNNMTKQIRRVFPNDEVFTAYQMGWAALRNGDLMRAGEANGFTVMITADQSILYQQNNLKRKIALIVLDENQWRVIRSKAEFLRSAVEASEVGGYIRLEMALRRLPKRRPGLKLER